MKYELIDTLLSRKTGKTLSTQIATFETLDEVLKVIGKIEKVIIKDNTKIEYRIREVDE